MRSSFMSIVSAQISFSRLIQHRRALSSIYPLARSLSVFPSFRISVSQSFQPPAPIRARPALREAPKRGFACVCVAQSFMTATAQQARHSPHPPALHGSHKRLLLDWEAHDKQRKPAAYKHIQSWASSTRHTQPPSLAAARGPSRVASQQTGSQFPACGSLGV